MVAGNGSAEAAHALRAAIPLMKERAVTLVTVGKDEDGFPATDALSYLSRHDVHAELEIVERGVETVEERLEKESLAMGAGLIVMGAFGRSRQIGRASWRASVCQYVLISVVAGDFKTKIKDV